MKKIYFLFNYVIVIAISLTVLTSSAHAQLYINEFMASNDAAFPGPAGDYPDWIEIYNAGDEAVMLGGYFMYDTLDITVAFQIPDTYPDSVTVAAGGYILFYANKDDDLSVLNLNFKLSGGGEQIGLWDTDQTMLDGITYDDQTTDISYGRYPDGTDDWGFMSDITPGASNAMPDPPAVQLFINEFMASNDAAFPGPDGQYPDWIEIYNAGPDPVMLGGYYMYDTLDATVAYQIPDTYPDSVTVAAGGYILFYANKKDDVSVLNLNFKLSGGGEQIGLWDADQTMLDGITYGDQTTDISYGRYPDGTDDWGFMSDITPGASNTQPDPPAVQLFINEFMASNDAAFPGPAGDYPDWIEIYNAGTEDVMLGGYFMYDTLDITVAFQIPDTYPDSVTVAAGGYILFYANKDDDLSVLNLNFKLSSGGEQIGLWSPEQELLDGYTYEEQITDTSYGRYTDGTDNWYFMSDFTPGTTNTNPNPGPGDVELYINEFMASNDFAVPGPQSDFPDWLEIYNAGDEAVMLGGYYLSDKLDDPEAMFQISDAYPDSVTVDAGGFIVFYCNKDTDWSVLNTNFKLGGSGEAIGLWDPNQNFLDSISFGPQIADTSYGRYTDGTDNWFMMPTFTPGATNIYVDAINENQLNVSLEQNYPNPFNNVTNIEFTLDEPDNVIITVYTISGAIVSILTDNHYNSGKHSVQWKASGLPAGYYFYSIKTSTGTAIKKASIIK